MCKLIKIAIGFQFEEIILAFLRGHNREMLDYYKEQNDFK